MAKEKPASIIAAPEITVKNPDFIENITPDPVPEVVEKTVFLVMEAFGDFRRGNVIADPDLIKKILASPQARFITPLENK